MKYPVSDIEGALREIACFFIGHSWKFSKSYYTELTKEEYEAWVVKTSHLHFHPNPFWHDLTSWRAKCRRCRRHTNERFPGTVWYRKLYWMITCSCKDFKWWFTEIWKSKKEVKYPRLLAFPLGFFAAWTQFFAQIDNENFPTFLWDWSAGIQGWLYSKYYIEEGDSGISSDSTN